MKEDEKWNLLSDYLGEVEAAFTRGLLESNSIPVIVKTVDHGAPDPAGAGPVVRIQIFVESKNLQAARQLLADHAPDQS
jgi:hypothetical protein